MSPSDFECALKPVDPQKDCPAFLRDDHAAALAAFAQTNARPVGYRYNTGSLNVNPDHLAKLAQQASSAGASADPAGFFLQHFSFFELVTKGGGLLTGFYEPEVEASLARSAAFPIPLYSRPSDLVSVDSADRSVDLPDGYRFARRAADGSLTPYFTRQQIDEGAIADRATPIAFVADRVTAFFIHVQGAACLKLTDGTRLRVTYAAKSGHPFTAIGRILVEMGEVAPANISMQTIKAWLYDHPNDADAMMWRNQSVIFFRQTPFLASDSGPIAAAKVPLSPQRSIAVDRTIHTFGTPFFIQADAINGAPFAQTMIAQDTGSAIVGPARADLYFGTGDAAGALAGGVKASGRFTIMIPHQSVAGLTTAIVD